jgi:hypothetical protein
VAGALAVLRSAFAGETLAAAESRLIANGTPIFDSRINRSFPRLNLAAAARPANDDFAATTVLSGASGSAGGSNRLATLQAGEPAPAGSGGSSVWWTWTAPADGQVSLSTAGSSFDTRLDVYTGAAVGGLSAVAANDNADTSTTSSSLRFQAAAGVTYRIAVSGVISAGFSTTVFPAAIAGAKPHPAIGIGKFQGTITPTTPSGSEKVMSTPPATGICLPNRRSGAAE